MKKDLFKLVLDDKEYSIDKYYIWKFYNNFIRQRMNFDIYYNQDNKWIFITRIQHEDYCHCGRDFTDTPDGKYFSAQHIDLITDLSDEQYIRSFRLPFDCIVCYYRKELQQGHFVPKWVRDRM